MSRPLRRYAAFLRGVSPMNCSMPELKRALEAAGFADVVTVLSSGNVVFDAPPQDAEAVARQAEEAMERALDRRFTTFVRPVEALWELLQTDPYQAFDLPPAAKRVVTFLQREPAQRPDLPLSGEGAAILCLWECEAYSYYVPGPRGPVFMDLLEKTFGKQVTTRTWDTVRKVASS